MAHALLRWDGRRTSRGRAPLAFAMHLRSDSVLGMIALRCLAALKPWRRRGTRYAEEQDRIERWMEVLLVAAGEDWQLAYEVALSGRLIKGYGETNERGKRNLTHILEHLARAATPAATRAGAIRDAREAALADEGGKALDATLVRHGAPPRPIVPQPIRWVPKARATETELTP
jgi:indolepyruvate ferredoxin oxidoreductase beta subunit